MTEDTGTGRDDEERNAMMSLWLIFTVPGTRYLVILT